MRFFSVLDMMERYLDPTGNQNLKLGDIQNRHMVFEVEILTLDRDLADRIALDRKTGWRRSVYGEWQIHQQEF